MSIVVSPKPKILDPPGRFPFSRTVHVFSLRISVECESWPPVTRKTFKKSFFYLNKYTFLSKLSSHSPNPLVPNPQSYGPPPPYNYSMEECSSRKVLLVRMSYNDPQLPPSQKNYYSQESINLVKSLQADFSINNALSPINVGAK